MQTHRMLVGGKWAPARSGQTFPSLDPATGRVIGLFQQGDARDVDLAVAAAAKAFPAWRNTPPPTRARVLFRLAALLQQRKEELARLVSLEMGKVLPEARGDVQEAIDTAEYFAGEGRRLFGTTTTSELREKAALTIRVPVGIVACITPWNFPVAIPSWKVLPALVCGNTVILKPSSDTPLCATRFVQLLQEAGAPAGVVNLVTGPGETVGDALVTHPQVQGISFTGNGSTGEGIIRKAGMKKVGVEGGGKNGIIILPDADLALALEGVVWGGYGTSGQRCTAASRVIVHEKIQEKFERLLAARVRSLRLGPGLRAGTEVGPLINARAVEKVHGYTQLGLQEGARLRCGGTIPKGKGFFYQPTLFTDVQPDMRIAREEIFGPAVSLLTVRSLDEAIDVMNDIPYGLSSAVYTKNITSAFRAIHRIEAGITYVNASTTGAEVHLPFGGVKATGHTREAGWTGVEEFTHLKTVYIDYSGRLQRAQMDGVDGGGTSKRSGSPFTRTPRRRP
ncbi:MAG: aldehyde dehydrogenase family protein [Candidatus Aenigmarchaeota archaeon]|nr:aldehyde dehydrogenase family protein [Candidatus Aenigmarchaeota archaeon]